MNATHKLLASFAQWLSDALLVIIFVIYLLEGQRKRVQPRRGGLVARIQGRIQRYMSIKLALSLANGVLAWFPQVGDAPLTLQRMLGWVMAPLVWLMGIPWSEAVTAGALMGTKTVLNELIAYIDLSNLPQDTLSSRTELIMIYAMCGFANLGSLGIMIGGLCTMAPERRDDIVALGARTVISGTLATCIAGSVVGIFY